MINDQVSSMIVIHNYSDLSIAVDRLFDCRLYMKYELARNAENQIHKSNSKGTGFMILSYEMI